MLSFLYQKHADDNLVHSFNKYVSFMRINNIYSSILLDRKIQKSVYLVKAQKEIQIL
jgi:hypothetical protein